MYLYKSNQKNENHAFVFGHFFYFFLFLLKTCFKVKAFWSLLGLNRVKKI